MLSGVAFIAARTFNVELIMKDAVNALDPGTFSIADIA